VLETENFEVSITHLTAENQERYRAIMGSGHYSDAQARILVAAFLEQFERKELARAHVAECGPVFKDRWGQERESPWCDVERKALREMARLYRMLGWDLAPPNGQSDLFGGLR
jgi:hypothetical protein